MFFLMATSCAVTDAESARPGRLEQVAEFNASMPAGVTVSREGRAAGAACVQYRSKHEQNRSDHHLVFPDRHVVGSEWWHKTRKEAKVNANRR